MRGSITYGNNQIRYAVEENPTLVSRIRIHVLPDGSVEVEAPGGQTATEVSAAVQKRARWIVKQLDHSAAARAYALPREYISGETHFYLGRRYQLKIVERSSEPSAVAMKGGQIHVTLPVADPTSVRGCLHDWYRVRAEDYLSRRLGEISGTIGWLKNVPPMKLVTMKKQWGSCSPSGSINLNPWLIKASRECIDYVITHELCHLREHNHSKKYYNLLGCHMPEWRRLKSRLDEMAELFLIN